MAEPRFPEMMMGEKPDNVELEAMDMEAESLSGKETPENVKAKRARAEKIRRDASKKAKALRE